MSIKGTTLLGFAIAIIGSAFFSSTAWADSVWIESKSSHATTTDHCLNISSDTYTCTATNNYTANTAWEIKQDLLESQSRPNDFNVTHLDLYIEDSTGGGNPWDFNIAFYNSEGTDIWTSGLKSLGVGEAVAGRISEDILFNVTSTTDLAGFRLYGTTPVTDPTDPIFRIEQNTYPNPTGFLAQGEYTFGASNPVIKDWSWKLWIDDTPLSIQYPAWGMTLYNDSYLFGSCNESFELQIYNNSNFASSTISFGTTQSCTDSSWYYNAGYLDVGAWYAYASSSPQYVDTGWYSAGQSYDDETLYTSVTSSEDFLLNMISASSTLGTCPVNAFGYSLDLCNNNFVKTTRPFSYPIEVLGLVVSGSQYARTTSSDLFAVTIDVGTSEYLDFDLTLDNSILTQIIEQEDWDYIRPWLNALIYLAFGFYLWNLIHRMI